MATIMLLHGLPGHGEQWRDVAAALAPHRVLTPTFCGFDPEVAEVTFPTTRHHAVQIAHWSQAEDADDLVCVAWSFACHPLLLALASGLSCRHAIFVEPSSDCNLDSTDRAIFQRDASAAFAGLASEFESADDSRLAALSFEASGKASTWTALNECQRQPFIWGATALRRALSSGAAPSPIPASLIANISIPCTVAIGGLSRTMFQLAADRLVRMLAAAEKRLIVGEDHLWPVEKPLAFAAFIKHEIEVLPKRSY